MKQPRGTHRSSAISPAAAPFVGRDAEIAALAAGRAHLAGIRLTMVSGDAGIGKTRLAREFATLATNSGERALWAQCWNEVGTPPYWPWTQVIRRLRGIDSGTDLAALVLEHIDPADADAFGVLDATAVTLAKAAAETPIVIVLDDLHLADIPSLQLTRFLVEHLPEAPIHIIATYRRDEAEGKGAEQLAALEAVAHRIALEGLDAAAIADLVGGVDSPDDIRTVTGGNPLLVQHLVRSPHWRPDAENAAGGAALAEVMRVRLGSLDPAAIDLLATLAVLGHGAVADHAGALVEEHAGSELLVNDLRRAGLIDPDSTRLTHPVLAMVVSDMVSPQRLADLHLAAARLCVDTGAPPAERAHHLAQAGAEHRMAAIEAHREAADVARAAFAHDGVARHLTEALRLLDREPATLESEFELRFALAEVLKWTKGPLVANDAYLAAARVAAEIDDPPIVARAAARHGIAFYADAAAQRDRIAECRAALDGLPPGDGVLRARLMAHLVAVDPLDPGRGALAEEAVAMARRCDDPQSIGLALVARQLVDLGPSTLLRRLHDSREIIAMAEADGQLDLAVQGRFLLKNALLENGDLRELDATLIDQDRQIAAFAGRQFARHPLWFRCTRALFDGRIDHAIELADECLAISRDLGDPDGDGVYVGQYGVVLWLRGRIAELEPAYLDLMRSEPDEPLWPAVTAWIALGDGRRDTAAGLLDRLPHPAEIPPGMHTLLTLVTMADVVAAVGDEDTVAALRDVLLPYVERTVPIAMGAAVFGVVARPLARLALRLGRHDEGIAHLERAIALTARMGARPWLAEAQIELANTLLDVGRADDPRIPGLAAEAAHTVRSLGLSVFADRVEALSARVGDAGATAAATVAAPADALPRISLLGTFEVRSADGRSSRWNSRKARSLLKILVARRGKAISREEVMGLLWPDEQPEQLTNRLAVAVSAVRRALDPDRILPVDAHVRSDAGILCLMSRNLSIDVEDFLSLGEAALDAHQDDRADARELLFDALEAYRGEPLPDEPYEEWAEALRSTVRGVYAAVLRAAVTRARDDEDALAVANTLRRLVDLDPYDEAAHLGLIDALHTLGAHGQARTARDRYRRAMSELGFTPADRP